MKKESSREEFKPCILSPLHIAGQSRCDIGVDVPLSVSERYRDCQIQPDNTAWEGVPKLFDCPTSSSDGVYWQVKTGAFEAP